MQVGGVEPNMLVLRISACPVSIYHIILYNIISYHIISIADLKWQKLLKVGTDKPKLEVTMQSVSDDDVRKRLLEKPRFELAAKGVFRLGRCCIFRQCVPGLWASNWESALRIRMTEE